MVSSGESGKIEKRMVVEYGITLDGVWLPLAMLRRLRTHGPWDAPFTEATADQERVLLVHALADRHNQAGLHRGTGLTGFLDAIPYEPTVAFPKLPADGDGPRQVGLRHGGVDPGLTCRERTTTSRILAIRGYPRSDLLDYQWVGVDCSDAASEYVRLH